MALATSLLDDLRTYLVGKAGVAAIVGTTNPRCWKNAAPQNAGYPRLVLSLVSREPIYHLLAQAPQTVARVQVDCQALSELAAAQLADAVRDALSGKGRANTPLASALVESEIGLYEPPTQADEDGIHRYALDFRVAHNQALPAL